MSLKIDDSDQIDATSVQTSNDDIFTNPLEAFPEFIDDPVSVPAEAESPVSASPVVAASEEEEKNELKKPASLIPHYNDPFDNVEEIDLPSFSGQASFAFDTDEKADVSAYQPENDPFNDFFSKTNLTSGTIEYEDVAVRKSEALADIDDSVPDVVSVTEEVSIDDFFATTGSETEEIDLDSFLGDSGFEGSPTSSNVTEEISLDDFGVDFGGSDSPSIDSFASSLKQEKSDIENAPAIDMELEFDDDFVLETKANPEDDIDFDFEALMAGAESTAVPAASQGPSDDLLNNFDDIFDNIVDETPASAASSASSGEIEFDPSAIEEVSFDSFGLSGDASSSSGAAVNEEVSEQKLDYDEVNEFDDLLSSFSDETHVEVADNRRSDENKAGPRDYNIIVVMEEEDSVSEMMQSSIPETSDDSDEDYVISIFKTEEDAEAYRRHDSISVEADAHMPSPDVSDVKISFSSDSGSFEDISLDDFGVAFEDETPAAASETAASDEPASEETAAGEPAFEEQPEEEPSADESAIQEAPQDEPLAEETFSYEPVFEEQPEEEPVAEEPAFSEAPEDEPVFEEQVIEESFSEIEATKEPENSVNECEDTTSDDKKIVELSEDYVYNGDITEDTSTMMDVNNEEITDTMNSKNEGLLEKIVSELSVLRNEMQTLRDEVQNLKDGSEPSSSGFEESVTSDITSDSFAEEPAFEEPVSEEQPAEEAVSDEPVFEEAEQTESSSIFDEIPETDIPAEPASEEAAIQDDSVFEDIPLPETPAPVVQEAGGFFSGDDDDETIALSGDELNNILNSADFTQEDGSNFGMEAPEGNVLPDNIGEDFSMEPPAEDMPSENIPAEDMPVEESISEEPVFDEPVSEEPAFEDVTIETPSDDFAVTEEAPADDFAVTEEAPAVEESVSDDFNTDLPSLKDDDIAVEETDSPAKDDFSLDDFDIPEPSVEENSIADINIDEPEEEPKAEDSFSLDDFDIPEPSAEESADTDINIDEPSEEIPSDQPAEEEVPADSDFYSNSDSPAISEEEMTSIEMKDDLEEPVLDDIDFSMDEPASEDIDIPAGDSLIVDSSSTDFLEEDDPTLEEQLTSEKVDYLNEEASVDDLGAIPEMDDIPAVEGMEDSLEADTLATSEDETPADDVFSSQWDETPVAAAPSFDSDPAEETVQAAKSFDDPLDFDIEEEKPADIPSEEPETDIGFDEAPAEPEDNITIDEPSTEIPADEPELNTDSGFEAPVEEPVMKSDDDGLSGDIKQEVKSVLKYMDQLLENLPEDKIAEFAQSEHFEVYKKLFNELGLV